MRFIENRWAPMVICDECHEPIDLRSKTHIGGIVAWRPSEDACRGLGTGVLYLHKGQCDVRTGARANGYTYWHSIEHHLVFLLHNAGLGSEEKFKQAKKTAEFLEEA